MAQLLCLATKSFADIRYLSQKYRNRLGIQKVKTNYAIKCKASGASAAPLTEAVASEASEVTSID